MRNRRRGLIVGTAIAAVFVLGYVLNRSYEEDLPVVTSVAPTPAPELPADSATPAPDEPIAAQENKPRAEEVKKLEKLGGKQSRKPEQLVTHPEFQKLITQAAATIPSKGDLQKLSTEEVHFTPASVQKAAIAIGDIAQSVHDHPEYGKESVAFYRQCAENAEYPDSVATTCLVKFRETIARDPELKSEAPPKVSENVSRLAQKLSH